jgi:chromosomal replication initiation ATPase DnaA
MAALYLCRRRTGLGATVIARAFNRGPSAVGYAVRSIERLLTEEPALGELLAEVERELQPGANGPPAEAEDTNSRRLR